MPEIDIDLETRHVVNAYRKGRRKEWNIMHRLRQNYDIVVRSAGSHSPIDLIAIDMTKKTIKFVQSKPDSWSEAKKMKPKIIMVDERNRVK